MRYYYDDPIKAAYMFETFKIEFETPFHYEIDYGKSAVFTGGYPAEKIYVRPERYELLKPRVCDMGIDADGEPAYYCNSQAWYNFQTNNYARQNVEIIQRDNKAWFSPEVEA